MKILQLPLLKNVNAEFLLHISNSPFTSRAECSEIDTGINQHVAQRA